MEGKSNKSGIRWKDDQFVWGSLAFQPLIDENDPVLLHGLNSPVKYVRLVRRELNGKTRYFAQLINEGLPYVKPKNTVGDDLIGLDLNVSVVAVVGDTKSELLPFTHQVPTYDKEIAALQRQMQRSQRTGNPENYESNFNAQKGRKTITKLGKPKKGKRRWNKSKHYLRTAQKKRELERRKTAYAKS
jgi:putative transposase